MTTEFAARLENFRLRVENDQIERYRSDFGAASAGGVNEKSATTTTTKPGTKFAKVDIGRCGRYMVEVSTGNIFGVKSYGTVHRGHFYGTLETTDQWFWGEYYPHKKDGSSRNQAVNGCPAMTYAPEPVEHAGYVGSQI